MAAIFDRIAGGVLSWLDRERRRLHGRRALRDVLAKPDDRLLSDVGLRREDLQDRSLSFRDELSRLRGPWCSR